MIDQHPVHRAYNVRSFYKPFHILFTPGYSSFFNPQEYVWSSLKKHLFTHFARLKTDMKKEEEFEAEVDYVCDVFARSRQNDKFIMTIRSDLEKYLTD